MPFRIIITTGGTGGHIFPALAVVEALRKKHPDVEVLFVGGLYGPEKDLASRAGVPFRGLPVRGFLGRGVKALSAGAAMLAGVWRALFLVRSFRPDAVMGFGGYAAFAAVLAAYLLGRPCALHEQNAVPGAANKVLGRLVRRICLSWPQRKDDPSFPEERCVLTGNPIREGIAALGAQERKGGRTLLVMGGSQGARAINNMVISMLPALREAGVNIVHQTGAGEYESVRLGYMEAGFSREETDTVVRPFIHDMAEAYASCDLALCRAGATSLAELAATGTPSVLIPFPFAAHDHQTGNARAMQDAGGGILLPQKDAQRMAEEGSLAPMILELLGNRERLLAMRKGALSLSRPHAASDVADELLALASHKKSNTW
ncbi:undecaprenyldiphospho-muramoylpentapeptide beta-N-acetylglucosaminyltransferase [Mailhella massiliensis]|uniref:UDP-N-acetylglucosamine--N-acetylmuramyl-(pentapeptide) pyrophosphoryl-undecaprenol N-acetylglucosamine transferase n=1 Tax=Mailhella massiliensis TaxID=1903261 RepID=A0A921AV26_9BACT|nr:undecaprenyldiphospho-muramoylpentapeptide beta-N-acetylglucosaminyltransferase [Mailhella massiliensis]HJD96268.1 undecaprenyldiphospho-muramoylpentapeptide beta-N-acetylglucosaminyltransferase [Mailhella massiliensis]